MILFDTMRNELSRCNFILSLFISGTYTRLLSYRSFQTDSQRFLSLGKVSLDRFDTFFKETEFLDRYQDPEESSPPILASEDSEDDFIGIRNASFAWKLNTLESASSTPSSQFKLTVPGKLEFVKGKINLIVGPTGSGKTSLLMALLGEMHFAPTHPDSGFSLPRSGGVSFAVQETWVQNETVKQNILFNSPYDEARYEKGEHLPLCRWFY
jgi:ABC-type multidrug transport system fused ATPase/permease subunit